MRILPILNCASALLGFLTYGVAQDWPLHDNGLNQVVQWDHYSIKVHGERLFIWSGELHLWRIPVPELWWDILEKVKAAGFNGIGLYEHWGWHAPNNDTLDFETGAHDFAKIFDIAKEIGLYVIYRPGPYSNAEANGGGFPGWLTTGEYGPLRDDSPKYAEAWHRYSEAVAEYVRPYLITNGGPIIMWQLDNEYPNQWLDPELKTPNQTAINYMQDLQDMSREWDIDVPLTHNNPNMWSRSWSKDWSDVGGEVDMYGLDHYPACWTCQLDQCLPVNGDVEPYTVFDYYSHFQEIAPTQPSFLMEFQGGSFNPWDGPAGGCGENMDATWVNLFFRHNLAQKVSAVNIYMLYGGTNWGNIGFPEVGTSYDYSSPIHENRLIGDKYNEGKLFGLFMRVARDFVKVNRVGNGTQYSTNDEVFVTELRNPDTDAGYYVTRHDYSPSEEVSQFRLHVSTTELGNTTIPRHGSITLDGIESKVLPTDFRLGSTDKKITYTTSEILTVSDLGDRQVVVFWAPNGQSGEFLLKGAKRGDVVHGRTGTNSSITPTEHGVVTNFVSREDKTVVNYNNGVQAVFVDRDSAFKFWAPTLDNNPLAHENATVLIHGPYLVRSAEIRGKTIHITGDWSDQTAVEIWAPESVNKATFNGKPLSTTKTKYGTLVGELQVLSSSIEDVEAILPPLNEWKVAEGLPEREATYDDSRWTNADHMETPHFVPPDTLPVLFADEYGYQAGNILWRGRFDAPTDDAPIGAYLRVIGGLFSGFSVYANGNFLGSWLGKMENKTGEIQVSFDDAQLQETDNVLFVIQDTMGKEQREAAPDPRGILNATLIGSDGRSGEFTLWKVAGNAGGNELLEPVRGTYNEGGLHGERLGWHLNGFDDSDWEAGNPVEGFEGADARFYRTVVPLDLPEQHDISLAFELHTEEHAKLRAQLYVNGYQFAKKIPVSNEFTFPVFPGILNYHGDNTIALSVWSMSEGGAAVDVRWKVLGVHASSLDLSFDSEYLRPKWEDRSQYA